MEKTKKITAMILSLFIAATALTPNSFINANNEEIRENEAAHYTTYKTVANDKQSVDITFNMMPKEGITIQSIVYPDNQVKEFNGEDIHYIAKENGTVSFTINYIENDENKSAVMDIDIEDIEKQSQENKQDENQSKESLKNESIMPSKDKDNIQSVSATDTMTELDLSKGNIIINSTNASVGGVSVPNYDSSKTIHIFGNGGANTIQVSGITATILMDNVSVDTDTATIHPMMITGNANVTLLLKGTNILHSNGYRMTVLRVDKGSSLTLDSATSTGSMEGSLSAKSSQPLTQLGMGAGIGGAHQQPAGDITILGGTIEATNSVGIGGYPASNITISGGNVTAQGGSNGAGIGGYSNHCGKIVINGGTVNATGGRAGAGIGNGAKGSGGTIEISGNANVTATGGFEAAGIGLGQSGKDIDISISGNPIIEVKGDRADIGGGGQNSMNGTISITGGTIHTNGINTAIGDSAYESGQNCIIHISDATISGTNENAYILLGKDITVNKTNITYDNKNDIKSSSSALLSNSKINMLGSIYTNNGKIEIDNTDLTIGNETTYSTITAYANKDIIVKNNSNINFKTIASPCFSGENITFENSKINGIFTSTSSWVYGVKAAGSVDFINSDIDMQFTKTQTHGLLARSANVNIYSGNIISNGSLYGTSQTGTTNIQGGNIKITNQNVGIYNPGNIAISDGYIDLSSEIYAGNELVINEVTGKGKGNAIIFASGYSGNTEEIEKGIIYYNENADETSKYKGYVLGDVTLSNLVENNGTQFTNPQAYTLYIQDKDKAFLTIPTDKTLGNDGVIVNESKVIVNGVFSNNKNALIYNKNLTPDKGTALGGEFSGPGQLTNQGDVQNEIYVKDILLDNAAWNKSDAYLSTLTGENKITSDVGSNKVFAHQGDTILYFDDIMGKNLNSEWKYINTDLEYFTLTYDLNYHNATVIPSKIVSKGKIKEPEEPKRNGYVFDGWYTTKDFAKKWNYANDEIASTTTLYAKWIPNIYKIVYHLDGGTNHVDNKDSYTSNDEITFQSPVKKGYTFLGWYDSEKDGNQIKGIDKGNIGDVDVYARWKVVDYKVNYHLNGGTNHADNITTFTVNDAFTFKEPQRLGYTFLGWYDSESDGKKVSEIVKGTSKDVDVYARWEVVEYKVNYHLDGGINHADNITTFTVNDAFTFKEPQRLGYTFLGWFDSESDGKKVSEIVKGTSKDVDVYARWEIVDYKVNYHLDGGINHADNITTFTVNDAFTFKEPQRLGYTFLGWFDSESDGKKVSEIVKGTSKDVDVYARWEVVDYKVNYHLNGGINHEENISKFTIEDEFLFRVPSKEGYTFLGWFDSEENGKAVNGITKGTSSDITVYARWEENKADVEIYKVVFDFMGGSFHGSDDPYFSINVFSDGNRLINIYPEDTALSKEGYTFEGWYTSKDFTRKWDFSKDKVDSSMTLYAKWSKVETPVKPVNPSKPEKPSTSDTTKHNVNTGDTTNATLYAISLIISITVLFALILKKKKENQQHEKK